MIVLCGDRSSPVYRRFLHEDIGLAGGQMMLQAHALGLGTCWINLGTEIHDPEMRAELGIPDNCTIVAPIVLGYPERIPPAPKRKEPEILRIITQ